MSIAFMCFTKANNRKKIGGSPELQIDFELARQKVHNKYAPYWAAAMFVFGSLGLATVWWECGAFWKGYLLDMVGPAWNYILFRGLFTNYQKNKWTAFFTPPKTFFLFTVFCFGVETAQYFKLYDATFDPYDYLAYLSLLLPLFILDLKQANAFDEPGKMENKLRKF